MSFINSNNIWKYATFITVLGVIGYFGTNLRNAFDTKEHDEYEMIKQYLLNDSPLYGFNKPKLWIHTKYEINARKYLDFYSKNTTDLNQAYLHICIKSIIDHCGDDFHICLISDESFPKLLPTWDIDLSTIAEPFKTQYRELALAEVLYYYGGLQVPNSFLCSRNLISLYTEGIQGKNIFVGEQVNRTLDIQNQKQKMLFIPSAFIIGSEKNNETMLGYVECLKQLSQFPHFTQEPVFKGDSNNWLIEKINQGKITLVDGQYFGVKTTGKKPILIEDLFEDNFLSINPHYYGIFIDQDEILRRPKYQWFAYLSREQVFEVNNILVKYMKASIVDTFIGNSTQIKSTISI